MEHHNNFFNDPIEAFVMTAFAVITSIIAWINIKDVLGIISALISMSAGIMAVRYYYYAIKEKKQNLKQ